LIKNIIKLLRIAKEYKLLIIAAAFIGFLTIGSNIGLMMTSAYLIAEAALMPSIAELQVAIVGVRFFGISRGIFRYFERLFSHSVTFNILGQFRIWFFQRLELHYPSKLSNIKSGDLLKRSVTDIENLEDFYVKIIAPPLVSFMILILFFFLFGTFSYIYSIIISVFFLLGAIALPILIYSLSNKYGTKISYLQKRLTELSIDQTQGLTELLIFNQSNKFKQQFNSTSSEYIKVQRKLASLNAINTSAISLIINLAVIAILAYAIPDVTNGILDGVYLSVLILGTMSVFEAVIPLPELSNNLSKISKSAENLFYIENLPTDRNSKEVFNEQIISDFSIIINSLNFSYNKSEPILNNINMEFPKNKVTVIVGASGSGKSTLINILLKLWEPAEGEISIGKNKLQNISKEKLREYFSVVPQINHLFNLSIKENIRFSNPSTEFYAIKEAAQKAAIHNFIMSLPHNYDEFVGEQGLKLSGGERQRLAIARALLKDSPIMIFDEPTSNLDAKTERKVLDMIYNLVSYKTVILITHRIVNLDNADNIYVLNEGKIVESGIHQDLIKLDGYYTKMYNIQKNLIRSF
jgi:ATP-binding cassette subfamily C protein CydC